MEMAQGTKDAVSDLASAVGEGFRDNSGPSEEMRVVRCYKCNTDNEADAKYCKNCGSPLSRSKPCSNCGELNDPDARFCDNCGKAIA